MGALVKFCRWIDTLNTWVGRVVAWATALVVVVVFVDVVMRYAFKTSFVFTQELEWHLFAFIFLMGAGIYIVAARSNMIKTLVGLGIFQTSVYLLYLTPGKVIGATPPILDPGHALYSNPLPHVLILTAIVVGVATLALGLAIVVRIHEAYRTIEEDEIVAMVEREDQR